MSCKGKVIEYFTMGPDNIYIQASAGFCRKYIFCSTSFQHCYGRYFLMFCRLELWLKLSEEERNIGTLVAFRTVICKRT